MKVAALASALSLVVSVGIPAAANMSHDHSMNGKSSQKVNVDDYTFQQKDDLTKALKKEYSRLSDKVDKLADSSKSSGNARPEDDQKMIQKLQADQAAAKSALDNLAAADTQTVWDEAKTNADKAVDALRSDYKDAVDHFRKENGSSSTKG
jgi:hypothetical protein